MSEVVRPERPLVSLADKPLGWQHGDSRALPHTRLAPSARNWQGQAGQSWRGVLVQTPQTLLTGGRPPAAPEGATVEWVCLHQGDTAHQGEGDALACATRKWYSHSYSEYGL